VTDGCATADKICRIDNCPTFFYFKLDMLSIGGTGDNLVTNSKYDNFTNDAYLNPADNGYEWGTARSLNSSLLSPSSNANILYRRLTNLCKLCDYRCMKCYGPSNYNCTLCVSLFYKWPTADVCDSYCPLG